MTDLARDRVHHRLVAVQHLRPDRRRRRPARAGTTAGQVRRRQAAPAGRAAQPEGVDRPPLKELLDRLPETMTDQTRTGTYGSWYSYYICGFSGRITLPAGLGNIPGRQAADRAAQPPRLPLDRTALQRRAGHQQRGRLMARHSEARILRLGVITLVVMALMMAAAFNLSKFPGLPRRDLPGRVQGRQRSARRQHGAGRRHPGRSGHRRRARGQPHRAGDLRGRQRRRVRRREPGVDRGAQPAGREVPRPACPQARGQLAQSDHDPASSARSRPTTSSASSAT